MGVDVSVDVGVGFIIDPEVLEAFLKENDEDEAGEYEVLWDLLSGRPLLTFGTGGSYYDSGEHNRTWISVDRLHQSHDIHHIPGGVFGLGKQTITLEERLALEEIALHLGQDKIEIGPFMSVLWH